ncbi:hypothetical protein CRG98_027349 [Punica granatum]|uniref:Uncharacterized protein n=1 Tax=Punica granatum TaxID=22663 RepID=A0A2I0J7M8_PUNGR|nr:hypothetical protein CRG98_027349 [Punica granatum]
MPARREDKQQTSKRRKLALWHYSSPDHRSVEKYPMWDSKNPSRYQSDQCYIRTHFRSILRKPRQSRTLAGAFPDRALGAPDSRTSFRLPFGIRLGLPRDVSVVTNASQQVFGTYL